MAAQHRGSKKSTQHIGGLDQPAIAQRFRSTLDYIDIGPYNLPETSTVNVEISPSTMGIYMEIWLHNGTGGFLWRKLLCLMASGWSRAEDSTPDEGRRFPLKSA
jgi:hypothetical protein